MHRESTGAGRSPLTRPGARPTLAVMPEPEPSVWGLLLLMLVALLAVLWLTQTACGRGFCDWLDGVTV